MESLFGMGERLTSFDFTGEMSPLMDTISTSPRTTQMFLQGLKAELDPIFRDVRQQTVNQLAANNQLQSSTTANRLATLESDLQKKYIAAGTQFGLADIDRAMRNRIGLFGTGLNTMGTATGMAGQAEARRNQFGLSKYGLGLEEYGLDLKRHGMDVESTQLDYENRVGKTLAEQDTKGGLWGGLTGALGGAGTGAAIGSMILPGIGTAVGATIGGTAGGAAGYFSPRGAGESLLSSGATMFGASDIGSRRGVPGRTASDDLFAVDPNAGLYDRNLYEDWWN